MDGSGKWTAPIVGALAVLCATGTAVAASGSSNSSYAMPGERTAPSGSRVQVAARILGMHNAERNRLSLEPLKWNVHLEREAEQWVEQESKILRPGNVAHIPKDVVHGTYNYSDNTLRLLAILGPAIYDGPPLIDVCQEEPWCSLKTPVIYDE